MRPDVFRVVVKNFEDLVAWQKAKVLAVRVMFRIEACNFRHNYGLIDQIRRAAVSVPANIAEGFDRGSRSEFHRFLSISKGSCAELRSHLWIAGEMGYLDEQAVVELAREADEVCKLIGALRRTVARHRRAERLARQQSQPRTSYLVPRT